MRTITFWLSSRLSASSHLCSRVPDANRRIFWAILASSLLFPTCAISTNANINDETEHDIHADELHPELVQEITNQYTKTLQLTPDLENGRKIYPLCAACHMKNGWGKPDGSFPVIAGQHRNVLIKQMQDIRTKKRDNPTMFPFTDPAEIGGLQGISDVTAYISSMPHDPTPGQGSGKNVALGEKLYQERCSTCHGKEGLGNNDAFFPRLKGQHHAYLLRQLKWIRESYRENVNEAMLDKLKGMTDEELDALADYLSRL